MSSSVFQSPKWASGYLFSHNNVFLHLTTHVPLLQAQRISKIDVRTLRAGNWRPDSGRGR